MSVRLMREIIVEAVVTDLYDGLIRLLADAQRFGFTLCSVTLVARTGNTGSATVSLLVPADMDANLVAARLARHPVLRELGVSESVSCEQAVAA